MSFVKKDNKKIVMKSFNKFNILLQKKTIIITMNEKRFHINKRGWGYIENYAFI